MTLTTSASAGSYVCKAGLMIIGGESMPREVRCVWVMCPHNSKYHQAGETGVCIFDGIITLRTPDEDMVGPDTEIEDLLICDQHK